MVPGVITRTTSRLTSLRPFAGASICSHTRDLLTGADRGGRCSRQQHDAESRHRDAAFTLLTGGQRDLQQSRADVGVIEEHLVEVTETKQQQVVRVALLELPVLPASLASDQVALPHGSVIVDF
jgi:hypothetical protein